MDEQKSYQYTHSIGARKHHSLVDKESDEHDFDLEQPDIGYCWLLKLMFRPNAIDCQLELSPHPDHSYNH